MQAPVLSSTVLLTVLLSIGLFFFIRASTKDRIEVAKLVSDQPETSLLAQLQQYFTQRAYRIATVDAASNTVVFEGLVRPSWWLAGFLTGLAAAAFLCLALVLSLLFPSQAQLFPALALLAPAAGYFYWVKSARPEQVSLQVEPLASAENSPQQLVIVTAHRDELAELQRSLRLKSIEE